MNFLKSDYDFSHIELDNVEIQSSSGNVAQEVEESSSNTRLHYKIQLSLCLKRIVQVYNEREATQFLEDVNFSHIDTFGCSEEGCVFLDDFNRVKASTVFLPCQNYV